MQKALSGRELMQAAIQLPVSWYFDKDVFQLEKQFLFDRGPGYVGHELMVPTVGDYYTLPGKGHVEMLVRDQDGVWLLSNICRHRQAAMFEGRGNAKTLMCPVHNWSYSLSGKLLNAPHFAECPDLNLNRRRLQSWNGLLFIGNADASADLANVRLPKEFDFSGYQFDRAIVEQLPFNWKTFMEFYLEVYHLSIHRGLSRFVSRDDVQWTFGKRHSLQAVELRLFKDAGTVKFANWHDVLRKQFRKNLPRVGAMWFVYYPNVMIEWYPLMLVVSTLIPQSTDRTTSVVEFYHPETLLQSDRTFADISQAAYVETSEEDGLACTRLHRGRLGLYEDGRNEFGPYQMPFEEGLPHFHAFLRDALRPRL